MNKEEFIKELNEKGFIDCFNEEESKEGITWNCAEFHEAGDVVDEFYVPVNGFVVKYKTQGYAPDGGVYLDASSDIEAYGLTAKQVYEQFVR